jgi:hypothetical protein
MQPSRPITFPAMRICRSLLLLVLLAAASSYAQAAPARTAHAHRCAEIHAKGATFGIVVRRGRVRCGEARKIMRLFLSGHGVRHGTGPLVGVTWTLDGWTCGYAAGGGGCSKHHDLVEGYELPAHTSKTCSRDTPAVINGEQKCLGPGEYCSLRDERQYERYGFQCSRRYDPPRLRRK